MTKPLQQITAIWAVRCQHASHPERKRVLFNGNISIAFGNYRSKKEANKSLRLHNKIYHREVNNEST